MADVQPLTGAISDDDELASVLAGVKNEAAALDASTAPTAVAPLPEPPTPPTIDFEETPTVTPIADIVPPASVAPAIVPPAPAITTPVATNPELEALKKETLGELRPLVGHLELPAEEKFDTLLLIIRSTDDQTLLAPAHEAAKSITDEARRAAALLDIIKEIDYFSTKG